MNTGKLKPSNIAEPWPISWFIHGIGCAALWQASWITVPSMWRERKAVATNKGSGQSPLYHCHILIKARIYPPINNPKVGFQKFGGST